MQYLLIVQAADRALLLLPQLKEYCTAAKMKKVTCPSKSVLLKATPDPLLTAKFEFFSDYFKDNGAFSAKVPDRRTNASFCCTGLGSAGEEPVAEVSET